MQAFFVLQNLSIKPAAYYFEDGEIKFIFWCMGIYYSFYRLYAVWFVLSSFFALLIYFDIQNTVLPLITKLICYPAIAGVNSGFVKRYFPFYQNQGISVPKLFLIVFGIDLIAFTGLMALCSIILSHA